MTWKISDVLILLITGFISLNGMIAIIALCSPFLEKKLSMASLSRLLKKVIIFSTTVMPILSCIVLYRLTFRGKIPLESNDFPFARVIENQTISSMTNRGNHWILILLLIGWIAGFLYYGIRKIVKTGVVLKKLEKYSKCCKEQPIFELKENLKVQLGIKGSVEILSNNIIRSPFTIGTIHQIIFLPVDDYSKKEWELLLKHELIHCKNKDYFFRKAIFILCSLYWFNPFIYRLADYFIEVNEMACDETVLNHQPIKVRSMYAAMIIKMQERENGLNIVSLSDCPEKSLERRIGNIMRKSKKIPKLYAGVLSMGIILMCPTMAIAASYGTSSVQDWTVRNVLLEEMPVQQENSTAMEITESITSEKVVKIPIQINPREAASIDVTINGKQLVELSNVSLSGNNKVSFSLEADDSSSSFWAGLIDANNKKTYVQSSDGWIDHAFTVAKAGRYTLFVEGTTSKKVHITGYVYVSNQ